MRFTILGAILVCSLMATSGYLLSAAGEAKSSDDTGFISTEFVDKHGQKHTFLVYVPYNYTPGSKPPLLLYLNGARENGTDGYWAIENNFGQHIWEMKREFPFVCAIPQCALDEDYSDDQLEIALDFADHVAQKYGTDPDRYSITGVCQGGGGVWNAINKYPERFAAAVPLCGSFDIDPDKLVASGLPIWAIYNSGDKNPWVVEPNREMRHALLEAGGSPLSIEYPAAGHDCWDRAYRSIGMWNWLESQHRTAKADNAVRFELLSAEQILDRWTPSGDAKWLRSGDNDELLAATSDGSSSSGRIISDLTGRNLELHADAVIDQSAAQCRLSILPATDDPGEMGVEVVLPIASVGLGGVFRLDGQAIAGLDPLGQRRLAQDYTNDVRVSCRGGSLTVTINGWNVVDAPLPKEMASSPLRLAFVADSGVQWGNVRQRCLDPDEEAAR